MHQLGDERLANKADDLVVTRRKDGTLVIAAWNLIDMDRVAQGTLKTLRLDVEGVPENAEVTISRTDAGHGNPLPAYRAMKSPKHPTREQIAEMNSSSALPAPTHARLAWVSLEITLPVNGLAIITIQPK